LHDRNSVRPVKEGDCGNYGNFWVRNRGVVGGLCFNACFSQLEPKPPSGGQTKRGSRPPRTPPHRTGGGSNSTSEAKAPRTPTTLAATTDVDSAEHKQLPPRRFTIQQTQMTSLWQQLLYTFQITTHFALVFRPTSFAHVPSPHPTRLNRFPVPPRRQCLSE
jgi:hypothetical protein